MKTKLLLISSIVLLFLSLPILMGNGETEAPKDKEAIKQELEEYGGTWKNAYNGTWQNKELLDKLEADKKSLEEKTTILLERNPYYLNSLDGKLPYFDQYLETRLMLRDDIITATTELAEFKAKTDELQIKYQEYEENKGPGYFDSGEDLGTWLKNMPPFDQADTTTNKINFARKLQAAGLSEGYIINVNFYHNQATGQYEVRCTTNVKGTMYWWQAGSSDVNAETDSDVKAYKVFKSISAIEKWLKGNTVSDEYTFAEGDELLEAGEKLKADLEADGYKATLEIFEGEEGIISVKVLVETNVFIIKIDPRNDYTGYSSDF